MRLGIHRGSLMAVCILAASLSSAASAMAATTWVVDGSNPACNDFGAGNEVQPLCTLLRATIRATPGDTVRVHPATYREQAHPPSGTPGAPVTFEATGPGVKIVGSLDVSDSALWTPFSGDIWRRDYINPSGQPQMMFADDILLTKGTDASNLGPNEWFWDNDAKVLYANVGGGNPGAGHTVEVGALSFGFQLGGKTHVVIDGFELSRQNFHAVNIGPSSTGVPAGTLEVRNLQVEETGSYGINVDDANSGDIDVIDNEVTRAGSHGIRLRNATNVDVLGNESFDNLNSGFAVHAASGNQLIGNTAYGNVNPRFRAANGIDVNFAIINGADVGSSNNAFRNNLLYDNQDSGFQIYNGSHDNLVVRNISHGNGDHGFDTLESTGTRYVSNTSYGNFRDGISIEGLSTETSVFNNISVDNGIGQEGFDLYVDDDGSIEGLTSDYNLFWKSVPETVFKVNDDEYDSVAAFSQATVYEDHGVGADPRFVNPAEGDFHLLTDSPAIDSAHSGVSGFHPPDLEGALPKDDLAVANTGAGSPPYADRGALEFDPPDTSAPDTTITAGPADGSITNSNSPSFGFDSTELGSTFECKLDTGDWEACTGPKDYLDLSDGEHTFMVRATDAAGNTDPTPATRTWTVDTAAPNTTMTAGPADGSTINSNSPSFGFSSSEPGSTFECKLDDGDWQGCTGPKSYSGLDDGTHTFTVRATDQAGNTDPTPATRIWTVDTAAPNTTITAAPGDGSTTSSTNALFQFTSTESSSTFECKLDAGDWEGCGSPRNYADLDNGTHTFSVRATDVANNTDESPASRTWTVDTAAPNTTITAGPGNGSSTNSTSASFEFSSSETPSTFECKFDDDDWENCTTPQAYSDLGEGAHTFSVRATDALNNTDPTPATRSWTVDTSAPNTTITAGPANGSAHNSNSPLFGFSSSEPGSTFECKLNDGDWESCTGPKSYGGLSDGEHTFSVRATDVANNTDESPASRTWTVDATPPDTTITSGPADGAVIEETAASFEFTSGEANSAFACQLDGGALQLCLSPTNLTGLSDGEHTFSVVATDQVGNTDPTPATRTFTIVEQSDDEPPNTRITRKPKSKVKSKTARFAFKSSEPNSTFQCRRDDRKWRKCTSPRVYLKFKRGWHVVRVRAIDLAGNVDPTPAKYHWRIVKKKK